jgi:hypothetical protein
MPDSSSRRSTIRIPLISTVEQSRRRESLLLGGSPIALSRVGQHQLLTVNDSNLEGALTVESSDPTVARIVPARSADPAATFLIVAVAPGSCQIVISDHSGPRSSIDVTVHRNNGESP